MKKKENLIGLDFGNGRKWWQNFPFVDFYDYFELWAFSIEKIFIVISICGKNVIFVSKIISINLSLFVYFWDFYCEFWSYSIEFLGLFWAYIANFEMIFLNFEVMLLNFEVMLLNFEVKLLNFKVFSLKIHKIHLNSILINLISQYTWIN